jgi:hypothetical protein
MQNLRLHFGYLSNLHFACCYLLLSAYCQLPFAYCPLPIAYCLLPFAYCPLPIAFCLLPFAYCLLPIAITLPKNPLSQTFRYVA